MIAEAFMRDANHVPITSLGLTATKVITYSTLTTGAVGVDTLFTITGNVAVRVFAVCSTLLTGANATLEVGVVGGTALILAQTTGTDIDAGEVWIDATPALIENLPAIKIVAEGADIIQTIATDTVDTGVLTYYCLWTPLSADGSVVAA